MAASVDESARKSGAADPLMAQQTWLSSQELIMADGDDGDDADSEGLSMPKADASRSSRGADASRSSRGVPSPNRVPIAVSDEASVAVCVAMLDAQKGHIGITLSNIVSRRRPGVLVDHVHPGDAADLAGLRAGDVIVSIGDVVPESHADGVRHLTDTSCGVLSITYERATLPMVAAGLGSGSSPTSTALDTATTNTSPVTVPTDVQPTTLTPGEAVEPTGNGVAHPTLPSKSSTGLSPHDKMPLSEEEAALGGGGAPKAGGGDKGKGNEGTMVVCSCVVL